LSGALASLDPHVVLVTGIAVLIGAVVQGAAGFGVSLVAVPVLTLLDPSLMPGALLVVGTLLPLFTLAREGAHVDWPKARLSLAGRLVGTAAGVWVISELSPRALTAGIGLLVLLGVALSLRDLTVPVTGRSLFGAGAMTGITGTASSISGPVIGLVLQRMPGPTMRATLAVFFCAGAFMSLVGLAVGGQLTARQVTCGLALLPFLVVGYLLSNPLRRYLDQGWTRTAVLVVSTCSALVVLAKAALWS
jgi:hypothetical protein